MKIRNLALAGLATLGILSNTRAEVGVSNLGEVSTNGDGWAVVDHNWVGMSFTVGTNAPVWILESVDMVLWLGYLAGHDFSAELHADNGGLPGALIQSLIGPEPLSPTGIVLNYVPAAATTLDAGATYWLTASQGTGGYSWVFTDPYSAGDTGQDGWGIGDNITFSSDRGATWVAWADEPALFAINVTPVPEPATISLVGVAALSLLRYRCGKRGSR